MHSRHCGIKRSRGRDLNDCIRQPVNSGRYSTDFARESKCRRRATTPTVDGLAVGRRECFGWCHHTPLLLLLWAAVYPPPPPPPLGGGGARVRHHGDDIRGRERSGSGGSNITFVAAAIVVSTVERNGRRGSRPCMLEEVSGKDERQQQEWQDAPPRKLDRAASRQYGVYQIKIWHSQLYRILLDSYLGYYDGLPGKAINCRGGE